MSDLIDYKDIKIGEVFTQSGSLKYPKLKLDNGYVDINDEYFNKVDEVTLVMDYRLMSSLELQDHLNLDEGNVKAYLEILTNQYS